LFRVSGLGPKGIKSLYRQLQVASLADLHQAAEDGRLATLPGFGEKKIAAILKGIAFLKQTAGTLRLDQALEVAAMVMRFLRARDDVNKVVVVGPLRRFRETTHAVHLLVVSTAANAPAAIAADLAEADFNTEALYHTDSVVSIHVLTSEHPVPVHVHLTPPEYFGAALLYHTGSQEHIRRLQALAASTGYRFQAQGLRSRDAAGEPQTHATEETVYRAMGLSLIDPRLRENRGEILAAQQGILPRLITESDMRGDLHMHTTASDGRCDISTLARRARQLGYEYICITDHSRNSAIANGLDCDRLRRQIDDIHELNRTTPGIRILAGTEVDILGDGRLDFDDDLLGELDFVIASIHQGLNGERDKIMTRIRKAMDNPFVHCIGHPTGRLIGKRDVMELDMAALVEHAAQTQTALEVNANPYRLDLRDVHCTMAIEAGVKLAICTDSHQVESLDLMTFGVSTAARGWVTRENVVNAMPLDGLLAWLQVKRR
jgi:DNA polymerase (family 10)